MPDKIGSIIWTISAKTDQLQQGLKTALNRVNVFKSSTENADKSASSFEKTIGILAQSFSSLDKSISSSDKGIQSFTQRILESGNATEEQAQSIVRGMADYGKTLQNANQDIEEHSRSSEEASGSSKRFANALKDVDEQTKSSHKNITSLKNAVRALATGYLALRAVRWITDQLRQSIDVANQTGSAMALTKSTIEATGMVAGMTSEKIREMANEIQRNTAISNDAAQAGMNILLQYTRIGEDIFPQATEAMLDMATAVNGGVIPSASQLQSTAKQLGSALNDPIKGTERLTDSGITFTDKQREQIRVLVESGRVAEAQGIILERLAVFQGAAERQGETFQGRMASIGNELNDIRKVIGNAVIPAIEHFIEGLNISGGASEGLTFAIKGLISIFIGLIAVARTVGMVLSTIFSSAFAAIQGDFRTAKNVLKIGLDDILQEAARTQETLSKVWSDETSKQTDYSLANFEEQELASNSKSKKIQADLEKETEAYRRATERRRVQFERSMADLVWAHQDKVKKLREDLKTEHADFSTTMDERAKKFNETMTEMEERHQKRVDTIEKQLAREEQKQEDKIADALDKGEKELDEEEKLFEKREAIIESQIEAELAKGEWASDSVLETLRRRLDNERAIHGMKVDEIKSQIDEETKKATDAHADRIEDLKERLAEATASNEKEKEKREVSYEEETTKLLREHQQRVDSFQSSLNEELAILDRHQDSVDTVKDKARLDDIARLKRQFEEQSREEERNHKERMADIRARGEEAGTTLGNEINAGLGSVAPQIGATAADIGKDINRQVSRNTQSGMQDSGRSVMRDFFEGMKWSIRNQAPTLKDQITNALSFSIPPLGIGKMLTGGFGFADGVTNFEGGMAMVGERGPEIVNLPRGSDVIPNEEIGKIGGNATVNINQVNEKSDVDMIIRELGFKQSIMH